MGTACDMFHFAIFDAYNMLSFHQSTVALMLNTEKHRFWFKDELSFFADFRDLS